MKKRSKLNYVFWVLFLIIVIPILIFNIVIIIKAKANPNKVPDFMGYKAFVVVSGSMQSNIMIGDVVVVKEINEDLINKNDIIAFRSSDNLVTTHRVIDIEEVNGVRCFVTKGDNNNTKDENVVNPSQIEGKYSFRIPKIGNFILLIQEPVGFAIMRGTILIIGAIAVFFPNDKRNVKDEEYMKEFEEFKKQKEIEKVNK